MNAIMTKLLLVSIILSPFAFVDGYNKMIEINALPIYFMLLFLWLSYVTYIIFSVYKETSR